MYKKWGDKRIAEELNRLKVPLGKGKKQKPNAKWTARRIQLLIPDTIYYGKHFAIKNDEYGNPLKEHEMTIVSVPACISEVLFRQATKARSMRNGGYAKNCYLLSGKLRDVSPSLPIVKSFVGAQRTKGGHSYRRPRFRCKENDQYFPTLEIPGKPLDNFVWNKIRTAFQDPQHFITKYLQLENQSDNSASIIETKLSTLRKREVQITEVEIPNLEKMLIKGIFDETHYLKNARELDDELAEIQTQISDFENDLEGLAWAKGETKSLKEASQEFLHRLEGLDEEQKQILCDLFVDRVEIRKIETPSEKRKIEADIFFRFKPTHFTDSSLGMCTPESQSNSIKTPDNDHGLGKTGQSRCSGYIPIRITAQQTKFRLLKHKPNGQHYNLIQSKWVELVEAQVTM